MPTYEYRCPDCANEFDKFQRMSDEPAAECPACGASAQRRISAGAGLVFKGSGFYITDYRGDSYKKAAESDKAPSDAKPESKPAEAKPATAPAPAASKPSKSSKPSKPSE